MPERFLGDWLKDAFLPFSQGVCRRHNTVIFVQEQPAGARACLGRRCELLQCNREQSLHGLISDSSKPRA